MTDLRSLYLPELTDLVTGFGFEKFRAKQIFSWLNKGASLDQMTNIPARVTEALKSDCYVACANIAVKRVSKIDGTVKYLFELYDGNSVEAVVMNYHHGYSMCLSTQVGCRMGCAFCATGTMGLTRNLTAGEMLAQIYSAQRDLGIRISNIVLMGMGEPLDNYDNTVRFLNLVNDNDVCGIGMRHITLSTCGLVNRIYDLMKLDLQITLSVSLHAPNDQLRQSMMPVAKKWDIETLLSACRDYADSTNRRISFEYTLINGKNDSEQCAEELADRLRGMLCHVNLIPVNSVSGKSYKSSHKSNIDRFKDILLNHNINVTVRRTLGSDISASCGQLKTQCEKTR